MIPTRIGQRSPGGYFAGINRIGTNCYAVIVSPKWTESDQSWKTNHELTPNTRSVNDGISNTIAMNPSNHPSAKYCLGLVVDGCNDFYLPALNELEVCYRNLKPGTSTNAVFSRSVFGEQMHDYSGTNLSSVPSGSAYTLTNPSQTVVTAFCSGNNESFSTTVYWTSTESSTYTNGSLFQNFSDGSQVWSYKSSVFRVRGIRRILLSTLSET